MLCARSLALRANILVRTLAPFHLEVVAPALSAVTDLVTTGDRGTCVDDKDGDGEEER